jgi:hypothetical protein
MKKRPFGTKETRNFPAALTASAKRVARVPRGCVPKSVVGTPERPARHEARQFLCSRKSSAWSGMFGICARFCFPSLVTRLNCPAQDTRIPLPACVRREFRFSPHGAPGENPRNETCHGCHPQRGAETRSRRLGFPRRADPGYAGQFEFLPRPGRHAHER